MRTPTRLQRLLEDWIAPLLLGLMLFVIGCLGAGCASAKANSQKTLAGIQYAKDAAMKTWGAYVAREQKRADALPEGERQAAHARLLERRLAVDEAVTKFQAAWKLAFAAANFDTKQPAAGSVIALLTDLETSVKAFSK